ncbi:CDP-glycerol glycerophosphotransferase family protein [Pseudomonas putida]|uniref:CDP-glycerol glycerophosphotransferase family protein n=1 Tax=Pseudomonas putida TaxID=303 RepID=UPI0021F89EEC|nr:CDP-glycerol glycerophosphotransferase family protein [Pseudomonas putida]
MHGQPLSDELNTCCLDAIPEGVSSIVEIGSGGLSLAQKVREAFPRITYTCITSDPVVHAKAKAVCDHAELAAVDNLNDAFFAGYEQHHCWLLGEMLAQVADPWALLRTLEAHLPEGGSVVVCMPNAQHWSLQVKLAAGAFGYQEEGLLHRSYLRWFTRETLLQLLSDTGFEMEYGQPFSSAHSLSDTFLPLIGQIAKAAAVDVDLAIADATPSHYIIRAVRKAKAGGERARPLLTNEQFVLEDRRVKKDSRLWVFPVCAFDHLLTGNDRAVFEAVRYRNDIRKVVLTRSKPCAFDGDNVAVLPLASREGQEALIAAGYIFVKHSAAVNAPYPLDGKLHRFINLWHGIPLKRIGVASLDNAAHVEGLKGEHARHHAVIASSKMDQLAMAVAFNPVPLDKIWITGLPRNDIVVCDEHRLPADFIEQLADLRDVLSGRRLVLFAPTFRNGQAAAYYNFSAQQRDEWVACLERHNAVLGIREHMADSSHSYSAALMSQGGPFVSLDRQRFSEIEVLYREAHVLVTDYSSCFIDFMLTGRPQISFAYDRSRYEAQERGMFYNLEDVFPGPVCSDFSALLAALEAVLAGEVIEPSERYSQKRRMFFEYTDDGNANRLVAHLLQEISP